MTTVASTLKDSETKFSLVDGQYKGISKVRGLEAGPGIGIDVAHNDQGHSWLVLTSEAGADLDLSGLVTKAELAKAIPAPVNLKDYATKAELPKMPNMATYATKSDLPKLPDMSAFATKADLATLKAWVEGQVAELKAAIEAK